MLQDLFKTSNLLRASTSAGFHVNHTEIFSFSQMPFFVTLTKSPSLVTAEKMCLGLFSSVELFFSFFILY